MGKQTVKSPIRLLVEKAYELLATADISKHMEGLKLLEYATFVEPFETERITKEIEKEAESELKRHNSVHRKDP